MYSRVRLFFRPGPKQRVGQQGDTNERAGKEGGRRRVRKVDGPPDENVSEKIRHLRKTVRPTIQLCHGYFLWSGPVV